MSYTSRLKLTVDNFSPETDLIEVFSKKAGVVGVINPSQIASPPSGVSGAIQFSGGSAFASDAANLFWDNVNKRLGIGTNAPAQALDVIGAGRFYQGFAPGIPSLFAYNGRAEADSTLRLDNPGGGKLYFGGYGLLNETNAMFGQLAAPSARVHIKGSGSTSATTSLLVQNSAGTEYLKVLDNGDATMHRLAINSALKVQFINTLNDAYTAIQLNSANGNVYFPQSVGIGTSSPTAKLNIVDNAGGTGNALLISHPTAPATLAYNPNASSLILSGGYSYLAINTYGGGSNALILGTGGPQGYLDLKENGTTYTSLSGTSTGNAGYSYFLSQLGVGTATTLGAKLSIKGIGSTSASTSLLVQNSSGTTALSVNDASNVLIGTTTDNGFKLNVNGSINISGGNKLNFNNGSSQCWITTAGGATGPSSRSILLPGSGGGGDFIFYNDGPYGIRITESGGDTLIMSPGNSSVTGIMGINKSAASGYGGGTFIYYQTTYGNRMYTFGNPNNERSDEGGSHTKIAGGAAGFLGNGGHVYLEAGAKGTQVGSVDGNIIIAETRGRVGIGTSSINASAILQADSVTQGFLKPRMTTTQKNAIASPAAGLEVFDTTLGRPCFYSGSAWVTL